MSFSSNVASPGASSRPGAWVLLAANGPVLGDYRGPVRIAEEILLLLVNDRTGRFIVDSTKLDNVLAGAVLVELATIERVGFAPAGGRSEARPDGRAEPDAAR